MNCRALRPQTLLALIGVLIGTVSCGSAVTHTQGTRSETNSDRIELSGSLQSFPAAASHQFLLGIVAQPYAEVEPSSMMLVDLESGEEHKVDGPVDGRQAVALDGLISSDEKFIGVGHTCLSNDHGEGCWGPFRMATFDPVARTWTIEETSLPDDALFDGIDADNNTVTVVATADGISHVWERVGDSQFQSIAQVEAPVRPAVCVVDGAAWLWQRLPGSTDTSSTDTRFRLSRVDLDEGETQEIQLPAVATYFGGVTTAFGCDDDGPVIATTPPGKVPAPGTGPSQMRDAMTGVTIWSYGTSWISREILEAGAHLVPSQFLSGQVPLLLGANLSEGDTAQLVAVSVGSTTTRTIPRADGDRYLHRGSSGEILRISDSGSRHELTIYKGALR